MAGKPKQAVRTAAMRAVRLAKDRQGKAGSAASFRRNAVAGSGLSLRLRLQIGCSRRHSGAFSVSYGSCGKPALRSVRSLLHSTTRRHVRNPERSRLILHPETLSCHHLKPLPIGRPERKDPKLRFRSSEAPHPHQAGRQARSDPRRRVGRRRAAPRDSPGRRAPVRHRRHAAQSRRARTAGRRSARRNVRPGPAGTAAEGPDDQRYPDQRSEEHLRRTPRQDGKDDRPVPRQQPLDADHRPHRVEGRPPRGRSLPDGRCPACRTARV